MANDGMFNGNGSAGIKRSNVLLVLQRVDFNSSLVMGRRVLLLVLGSSGITSIIYHGSVKDDGNHGSQSLEWIMVASLR